MNGRLMTFVQCTADVFTVITGSVPLYPDSRLYIKVSWEIIKTPSAGKDGSLEQFGYDDNDACHMLWSWTW